MQEPNTQPTDFRMLNDPSYQPQFVKDVPIHRLGKVVREKFNSTASLFITTNQLLAPNVDEILKCLSVCLYYKIKENETIKDKVIVDVFLDEKYPIGSDESPPSIDNINAFLKSIYDTEQLSAECAVMVLIFIERLIAITKITLDHTNWRSVCFGAIIIASKVWEDTAVWNSDFQSVFPRLQLSDLGNLERQFLRYLDFNVAVKSSVYANYYFSLRTIAERNEINFPLQPLTKQQEEKLEHSSQGMEKRVKGQFNVQRSQSLESFQMKDVCLGIEDFMLHDHENNNSKNF
jgi:hypothetical protein